MGKQRGLLSILKGIALLALLSGCEDAIDVQREYPSTLGQALYLKGLPSVIPVHLDAVPASAVKNVQAALEKIAGELSRGTPVAFIVENNPDGRDFALRIAMQPGEALTALTLCQGEPIGRLEAPQRSRVVIAAICHDRRRLGEVRAVRAPGQANGQIDDSHVVDAAVRKLFALPARE
ncbi:hypothetical protein [Hwanghaeella sp.]|uniref:hypothetical protein n=1 Tax=Hwanghaeella sp. TaxID=2605943 RepID=UPI003CCB8723